MIVQNKFTSIVVFATVVLIMCVLTGMMLGNVGPFNSDVALQKVYITQTQAAISAQATQSSFDLSYTQQAPVIQQTVAIAQMTAAPFQQTAISVEAANKLLEIRAYATQTALVGGLQNDQYLASASQTAMVDNVYVQSLLRQGTVTAIAETELNVRRSGFGGYVSIISLVIITSTWLLMRGFVQVIKAVAYQKNAQARLLAEQHKLLSADMTMRVNRPTIIEPASSFVPRFGKDSPLDKLPKRK